MNNPLVIAHVPADDYGHAKSFLANILGFRTRYPMILFSSRDDIPATPNVTVLKIPHPGFQKPGGYDVTNLIYLTALRIAFVHNQYSHILYVEDECRVGCDEWDAVIFDEFFSTAGERRDMAIGGTPMCFGEHGLSRLAPRQWGELLAKNVRRNFPIPTYGAGRVGDREVQATCVTVCGALGVYPRQLMLELFNLENTALLATKIGVWDFEIGLRLWKRWQVDAFDHVIHLTSLLSSFDLTLSTEDERRQMLGDGLKIDGRTMKVVAVHKIKSAWTGPERIISSGPPAETPMTEPVGGNQVAAPVAPEVAHDIRPVLAAAKRVIDTAEKVMELGVYPEELAVPRLRTDILIVTCAEEVEWLGYCLKSIAMHCSGFFQVLVVAPKSSYPVIDVVVAEWSHNDEFPFRAMYFDSAPHPKEKLNHELQVALGDISCPDCDAVLHVDAHDIFMQDTTPDDYLHDTKAVMLCRPYTSALLKDAEIAALHEATETALKLPAPVGFIAPMIHWRETHAWMRTFIETRQGLKFAPFVLSRQPHDPIGFNTAQAIGTFAANDKRLKDRYTIIDITKEEPPPPKSVRFLARHIE